jgi:hypothetical protein
VVSSEEVVLVEKNKSDDKVLLPVVVFVVGSWVSGIDGDSSRNVLGIMEVEDEEEEEDEMIIICRDQSSNV